METDGIASRLKYLINSLGLSDSQFADKCGISRATLSLLLSGKNKKISDVLLSQIHTAFPDVSIMWLLFKEGDMNISSNLGKLQPDPELVKREGFYQNHDVSTLFEFDEDLINDEDLKFTDNKLGEEKKSNLIGLNMIEKQIQEAVTKGFERYFKNYLSHADSEESEEKGKKIRQITVYYDDSTFETFSPGN